MVRGNLLIRLRAGLHCAYKISKFFTLVQYVEGVYTLQNGAYECNSLTAYSVGGHNIMLNWMAEITDLLQLFVAAIKFGLDYTSREVSSIVFLII